jgi:hypothetical protein
MESKVKFVLDAFGIISVYYLGDCRYIFSPRMFKVRLIVSKYSMNHEPHYGIIVKTKDFQYSSGTIWLD